MHLSEMVTVKKKYKVTHIAIDLLNFGSLKHSRKENGMIFPTHCWQCHEDFIDSDNITVAVTPHREHNIYLCHDCGAEVQKQFGAIKNV